LKGEIQVKGRGSFDSQRVNGESGKLKKVSESYPHAYLVNKYFILQVLCFKYLPTFAVQI
jgi:hypothetical protein